MQIIAKHLPYLTKSFITFGNTTGSVDNLEVLHIKGYIVNPAIVVPSQFLLECSKVVPTCQGITISQFQQFLLLFTVEIQEKDDAAG